MVSKIAKNGYANLRSVFPVASSILSSKPFHQRELSPCSKISGVSEKGNFGSAAGFSRALFGREAECDCHPAIFLLRSLIQHSTIHSISITKVVSLSSTCRQLGKEFSTEGVLAGLIAANTAVSLLWMVAPTEFMVNHFTISADNFKSFRVHTLITSGFSHHDTFHFMTNMTGLLFFGTSIGHCFGPEYLLKLYLAGAYSGSAIYLAFQAFILTKIPNLPDFIKAPAKGASGAVNAVVVLGMCLYPLNIVPAPAMLLGLFLQGMDVSRLVRKECSGLAQIGGAAVALIAVFKILFPALSI